MTRRSLMNIEQRSTRMVITIESDGMALAIVTVCDDTADDDCAIFDDLDVLIILGSVTARLAKVQ